MMRVWRGREARRTGGSKVRDAHRVHARKVERIVQAAGIVLERRHWILTVGIAQGIFGEVGQNDVLAGSLLFARHGMNTRASDEQREKHEEHAREAAQDCCGMAVHASEPT